MTELVTYTSHDHIATITINRADRMNALNEEVNSCAASRLASAGKQRRPRRRTHSSGRQSILGWRRCKRRTKGNVAGRTKHWRANKQARHCGGQGLVHWRFIRHRTNVRFGCCGG